MSKGQKKNKKMEEININEIEEETKKVEEIATEEIADEEI